MAHRQWESLRERCDALFALIKNIQRCFWKAFAGRVYTNWSVLWWFSQIDYNGGVLPHARVPDVNSHISGADSSRELWRHATDLSDFYRAKLFSNAEKRRKACATDLITTLQINNTLSEPSSCVIEIVKQCNGQLCLITVRCHSEEA